MTDNGAVMNKNVDNSKLITFYSFKGGVGRTMALANTACYLANTHNLNLVLIDWDLEAPGLHYYFGYSDDELKDTPGLIDYLEDFRNEVVAGEQGKAPHIDDYLTPLPKKIKQKIKNGSINLLTCGKTNSEYTLRVQEFDWKKFYEEGYGFEIIETLKSQVKQKSDVALIDSRAGQADIGTTSTIQFPDAVVMFFTSNRQSVEGTERIATTIKSHPFRKQQGMPDLKIFLVPSRVFPEEDRFNKWLDEVAIPMQQRLAKGKILDPRDQPKGLRECILGIDPRFTFDEALPAIEDKIISRLNDSYKDLAQAICDLHAGRDLWSTHKPDFITITDNNRDTLLRQLNDAAKRGDEHKVAYITFELGRLAINDRKYEEAESLLQSALAYHTQRDEPTAILRILGTLALLRVNQGRVTDAENLLNESFAIAKKTRNRTHEAGLLHNLALLNASCNKIEEAKLCFNSSLKISKRLNDPEMFSTCLLSYAETLLENDRSQEAISRLKVGLDYLLKENVPREQAEVESKLGDAYLISGKVMEAFKSYEAARLKFAQVGDVNSQLDIIGNLVELLKPIDRDTALKYLEKIANEKNDVKVTKLVRKLMSKLTC